MLRRLVFRIAQALKEPDPESVRRLRELADLLNEQATRYRVVTHRAALLAERIDMLDTDLAGWERREVAARRDPKLEGALPDVSRMLGRVEGQLQETRAELVLLQSEELSLRALLSRQRTTFADLVERNRKLGYDVSACLLHIDLTQPDRVADVSVLADDDRDFLARVVDASGSVH